ncbi:PRC-barrel domain-containing protein [Paraburkholderia rhizosphaerae]|uniref:PRC-barrel domain protein n=1 Tax=Paraburkholderia rhizosphaerae TaxID=480658 RepID=A0A4V3HCZ7_9BURK|nr:PRC-barrel domain-containing protein [Paraburkholderia rhizosphaerae]TDY39074.1 PRC-barrel domain protein [Paraburkholderia rhizosphaerae]
MKAFFPAAFVRAATAAAVLAAAASAHAQVAGTQTLGVSVEQSQALLQGWSAKKSILGKPVYNDSNEKIGSIFDIVIAPDGSVSAAVVSTGGFLGVASHNVAVPIQALNFRDGNFYLPGATKDALKATPAFQYSKVDKPKKPQKTQSQAE